VAVFLRIDGIDQNVMKTGFWTSTSRYGVIHQPAETSGGKCAGCLLVFVHGLFGDCRRTWGRMPEWVLAKAQADVRVISFSYPSRTWQRSSIAYAADDLHTWLETEFRDERQILFVAHSSGGLIVKQMLNQAFQSVEAQVRQGGFDFSSSTSIWLRTRHVINIAVPHRGGSPVSSTAGMVVYNLIYPFMAPFLWMARFLSQGTKDWGRNEIIGMLRWKNRRLLKLENEFVEKRQHADEWGFPSPMIHDVYAKSDLSVPLSFEAGRREIYFRGTHKTVKIPNRPDGPVVGIVADFVRPYATDTALTVTDRTMARIATVNKLTGSEHLISNTLCGIGQDRDQPRPTVTSSSAGTQAEVVDRVVEAVRRGSERPKQMVVTGAAGVGKSLVMRMIAWRLARRYLADPGPDTPLPLFIPLQQVTLGDLPGPAYSWELLWEWWHHWAKSLFPGLDCDQSWLETKFHSQATTVILDGLDDFLLNVSTVGLSMVVGMLREVLDRYADNPRFSIVIGIRSSFYGLQRLATDPKDIYEVLRLSVAQAKQLFPKSQEWIDTVHDRNVLDLVLTPLILSNYEPEPSCVYGSGLLTQASVMCQTIRTILVRSHLLGVRRERGQAVELDHLMHALALTAWLFFYKSRGEISLEVLRREARIFADRWERFFQELTEKDPDFYYDGLADDAADILAGFRLLEDAELCQRLLQGTVFVPTGANTSRFTHRNWQEFLLAQYFVLCIRTHHFSEFGAAAFHSRIYRLAGEAFQGGVIAEDCIQALLESWSKTHNTFITGNVIAFLTWTRTAIDARAIRLLLDEIPCFGALSRLVLIGGLGYRVLVNHPDDHSLSDLRRALFPTLRVFANPNTAPVDDRVVISLSWCYQKAFSKLFGTVPPEVPWPAIGFEDTETLRTLAMVSTLRNDRWILDERSRSLQLAFLVPILETYKDAQLTIRAVHYLYYLVVARKHDAHIIELNQELSQLLAPGSKFEKIIESFTIVPEVFELYRRCQAMHAQLESAVF
jgi:pimeloyl-ACP methyl ester carboxylesterase